MYGNFVFAVDLRKINEGENVVYMYGHSMGLAPKKAREYVLREVNRWEKM